LPLAIFACIAPVAVHAAEEDEAELLAVLQQETDIATKTRMNSDFVPGIVTILEGDRLRALGARTVWEAMNYVPGVQTWLDGNGTPSATVRGLPFPFNSGSIQILLNGSPIFREAAGLNGSVLLVPMAQVERIEFIRGPGSILYGDYAFMGLVNIVTRKQGEEIGASVDSHGGRDVNLLASGGSKDGWQGSLNLAGHYSDDALLPDTASGNETRFSGVANVAYGGFSLQAQAANRKVYDVSGTAPRDEKNWSGELRYRTDLSAALGAEAHVQYLYNDLAATGVGAAGFKGDEINSGVDLHWSGWARQNWVAGVEYSDANIDRASFQPPPPPGGGSLPPYLLIRNKQRSVGSVYAQDQIDLLPTLTATLGARYDDNSEIGERVTPRAALAWQPAEHHILKAQYSEGFRAPTFFELYTPGPGVNDLDFEVNRTVEVNYVYERPRLTFRATAYHMRIENMVFPNLITRQFGNNAHAKADGAEFELTQQLGDSVRIDANLAYANARDNRDVPLTDQAVAQVPHWMGNLGLLWNPARDLTFGVHWNHVGARPDARPASGKYDLVDVSATQRGLLGRRVDVEIGVSNLFDKRVVELAPTPFGSNQLPYQDRVAFVRAAWRW
jgi:iron complex outermembrane receptor protein